MYEALEKAREEGGSTSYWQEDNPRCPHCGETYDVHDNEDWGLYDSQKDEHEISCPNCEKEFTVNVTVSFYFSPVH